MRDKLLHSHSFRAFALSFAGFFLAASLWSLATPLLASPDEPVQITKAAAEVRGQLTGHLVGNTSSPNGIVKVPKVYATPSIYVHCANMRHVSSFCNKQSRNIHTTVPELIYIARYQPLYYAAVGVPTLFTSSLTGIYLMRIESAAISAVFLALAVMTVVRWSKSRLMLAGVLAAATPTVLFFSGMVNPIGLEASTAICLWTAALILAREQLKKAPVSLLVLIAVAACVETFTRSMSPFWVALTFGFVLSVAEWGNIAAFVHRKRFLWAAVPVITCTLVAVTWIKFVRALNVKPVGVPVNNKENNLHILFVAFSRTRDYYDETIGTFGRLDIHSPQLSYVSWTLVLGILFLLAIYVGKRRERLAAIVLAFSIIILPVLISFSQARRLGIVWQGSDALPLFVGLPILCAAIFTTSSLSKNAAFRRWMVPAITVATLLASLGSFFASLRRYAVGVGGTRFAIFHSAWHPPLGVAALWIAYIVVIAGIGALFIFLSKPSTILPTKSK